MLELAVTAPVVLLVLFGAADFGRMFSTAVTVANASAAGALYATASPTNATDTAGIAAAATQDAADLTGVSVSSVTTCRDSGGNTTSCSTPGSSMRVSVTASYTFNTMFNYPLIPNSVRLQDTATVRVR